MFSCHTAMPPLNYVKFTSTSGNVICQRCKVLFPEGVELHFLHDMTGEGPEKNVCDECTSSVLYYQDPEREAVSGYL
jgi:hypothetical protein